MRDEDYSAVFLQRFKDVEVLHQHKRYRAAMHLGGITIECLLKALIWASLPTDASGKKFWKTETNAPGHAIENPEHNYTRAINAIQQCNRGLHNHIRRFPKVLEWLREIEQPDIHFIAMRYEAYEPDAQLYQNWYSSYKRFIGWLQNTGIGIEP